MDFLMGLFRQFLIWLIVSILLIIPIQRIVEPQHERNQYSTERAEDSIYSIYLGHRALIQIWLIFNRKVVERSHEAGTYFVSPGMDDQLPLSNNNN